MKPGRTRGDISEVKINAQGECEVGTGVTESCGVLCCTNLCVVQLNIEHPCTLRNHRAFGAESSALFPFIKYSPTLLLSVGCSQSSWDPPPATLEPSLCVLHPSVGAEWELYPSLKHPTSFWHWESNFYTELCWQCSVGSYFTSAVACAIYIVHVAATGGMMNGLCVPCFLLLLISDW